METRTRVALGLAGGYLLGRFRKARWLLALAAVGSSPEVRKLIGQGREAVVGALHTGMEGLTERIHATTESLRADGHKPAEGEPEEAAAKEEPEAETEEKPEAEAEDEPKAEEEPEKPADEESDTAASDVKPPGGAPAHKETAATEEASAEATGNPPDRDRRGQGGSGDDHSRRSPSARVSGRPTGVRGRR